MVARKLTEKEKKVYWEEKRKEILAEHPGAFITVIEVTSETDENGKPVYGKMVYHKPIPTRDFERDVVLPDGTTHWGRTPAH